MEPERYEAEVIGPETKKKNEEYYLEPEPPRRRRWPWFVLGGCVMLCCLCFVLPLALVSIGGVAFSAVMESSEVTERGSVQIDLNEVTESGSTQFDVDADALDFTIENEVGDVTIETGADDVIAADFVKRAYGISRNQARNRLDDVTVELQEVGEGAVRLSVNRPSSTFSLARVESVDLIITVPAGTVFDLDVNGGVGAVRIGRDVQVSHVDAQVNVGELVFNGVFAGELSDSRLRTNVGEIRVVVPDDLYARVEAETNVGNFSVDSALASSDVEESDEVTGHQWHGTLGEGSGTPPRFEMSVNVGDIRIEAE